MKNRQIARIFTEIADILEIKEGNPFKIRAYRRASLNLEGLNKAIEDLSPEELREIPGIGEDLAAKIEEFLQKGTIYAHEKLKEEVPPGLVALLSIPGLGPKKARHLFDQLGLTTIAELERAATEHRLAGLRGIKEKTEENILKGIATLKKGRERRPLGRMLPAALELVAELKKRAAPERIEIAGSLRRYRETIRDIDLVAASPDSAGLMAAFTALPQVEEVLLQGPTKSTVLIREGIQVDLRVVERASFGAALAYLTGSKMHNVRLRDMAVRQGLKINEYGIFSEKGERRMGGEEEEDVYRLLGLPFIPPELREDQGEIEAALEGRLPSLITLGDIRGDLHVHSKWSDGAHTIPEIAAAARQRGLAYIALTDHSQGLGIARGLTADRLREQQMEVDEFNRKTQGFRVLRGTEIDIRIDGSLDFPDELLQELDVVVASIHSGFKQSKEQLTARIIAAMRNPWVSIIAHPTGRVIGERDAYQVEMEEVLQVAKETGTAMEMNAYPLRLDLNETYARRAKELGVPLAINTDSHVISQMDNLPYGVAIARRSWLEKGDVLNTLELPELLKRLEVKRKKRGRR